MATAEIVLLVGLVLVASVVLWRLQVLRRGGTEAVVRLLPAPAGRGWRHGVLRYRESELQFFGVASVRPGVDVTLARSTLVVLDRRSPAPDELDVLPPGSTVLHVRSADAGTTATESEIALSGGALTAFLSWVESSPPGRARRARSRR